MSGTEDFDLDRASVAREVRRSQILAAARDVFAEHGFHRASINEIIKRAAIARGTFYLYFESKESVFDSILDEVMHELRARIRRIDVAPGAPPPAMQLRTSLISVIDYVVGDQSLTRILLEHGQTPDTDVADRVAGFFGEARGLIQSSLDHGIGMGLVRECNTGLVAATLLGAVRGAIQFCLSTTPRPSTEEVVDELIAFALRGVLAQS